MMRIRDFYKGKTILVTGATGLVGKALIEKLLRSCPDVKNIYVIIRPKRGQNAHERWLETTEIPLFNLLKTNDPKSLEKVIVFPGDSTEDNFGLSDDHLQMIFNNVNIVYHGAASLNFIEDIVSAAKPNLKSTYVLLELSKKIKNLEIFVQVSTSYTNFPVRGEVEEKVYDSPFSWRDLLALMKDDESCEVLLKLQPKLMNGHLSTYTLTKQLAESLVDSYKQHFPVLILRPALVSGTYKDPMSGWTDQDNFITLFCRGTQKGVIRVIQSCPEGKIFHIPLDLSIRALIIAPWKQCVKSHERLDVVCCQLSLNDKNAAITPNMLCRLGLPQARDHYPDEQALWYPYVIVTPYRFIYYPLVLILHILPSFFIDFVLSCSGRKPILKKVHTRIWALDRLNQYYVKPHHWFSTKNFEQLEDCLLEVDREDFSIDVRGYEAEKCLMETIFYFQNFIITKNYTSTSIKPETHARMRRLKAAHYTLCTAGIILLFYLLLKISLMLF